MHLCPAEKKRQYMYSTSYRLERPYLNKPWECHNSYFLLSRVQMWIPAEKDMLFLGSWLCKLPEARTSRFCKTFSERGGSRSLFKLDKTLGKVKPIPKLSTWRTGRRKQSEVCPLVLLLLCTSWSIWLWQEEDVSPCSLRKAYLRQCVSPNWKAIEFGVI